MDNLNISYVCPPDKISEILLEILLVNKVTTKNKYSCSTQFH